MGVTLALGWSNISIRWDYQWHGLELTGSKGVTNMGSERGTRIWVR